MEHAKYLMSANRKLSDSSLHSFAPPPPPNLYGDSWEEQAFAEDAAGILGGCVWPPRSYSCSFCRREFRSAQALGGHMNVHRRDRARLKQSSPNDSSKADQVVLPQNHALNPCTVSFDHRVSNYPYSSSTFLYNNNPDFQDIIRVSSPPPSNIEEKTKSTLSFFSPIVHKHDVNTMNPSWSSFVARKRDRRVLDLIENNEENKYTIEKGECVREDHLSLSETYPKEPKDGEIASFKRRRIEANILSFLPKLSVVKRCNVSGSFEELDLELRLGDAPKEK